MKHRLLRILVLLILAAVARGQTPPVADHHQHIFSPPLVKLLMPGAPESQTLAAADVIALLDQAGIQRALLLSVAYTWGNPSRTIEDEYTKVRAENDWNSAQAALYPKRLRVFCSFNPLEDYALAELERCAKDPNLKRGLKLHFGNSDVQLENPAHVEQLGRVFRAANQHRMTIVVHLRASISKQRPYGAIQARVFLEQLLPLTRNIDVQVAHLAGSGPGYDDRVADEAMAFLAEAMERRDRRTRRLWFDVAGCVDPNISPANAALVTKRIRQVGLKRILYGSDAAAAPDRRPRESWAAFRRLPLTEAEFNQIARNVAPYLR
ncbi:MAG TPA: amidohydrolase family protein [Pyrinomonadaceae bacterium]